MSLDLNKVILAGRLTSDPELKQSTSGLSVTSFSLAVNRAVAKDAEKKADFINIVAWRQTAEFITRYFHKGSAICVVGSIQTRSWKDQNGNTRYATEVVVDEAKFVESKSTSEQSTAPYSTAPSPASAPASAPQFEELSSDDDLPF